MEICIRDNPELDGRILMKIQNHECISEPELLNRITDIMMERDILRDEVKGHDVKVADQKSDGFDTDEFNRWIESRKNNRHRIPEFESGYVVIDMTDNHVLENKIFVVKEEADQLKKRYYQEMPSLIDNHYEVLNVTRECLQYGAFPYEDQMYFIYDIQEQH